MSSSSRIAALVSIVAAAGCYTVPISTNVATNPRMKVTSEASKLNVLWITPLPPETSAELLADLMEQCGNRGVTGVTIGTQVGFAVIGQQEKIVATGYCVEWFRKRESDSPDPPQRHPAHGAAAKDRRPTESPPATPRFVLPAPRGSSGGVSTPLPCSL